MFQNVPNHQPVMIYNQLDGENQLGKYDVQSPTTHWTHD